MLCHRHCNIRRKKNGMFCDLTVWYSTSYSIIICSFRVKNQSGSIRIPTKLAWRANAPSPRAAALLFCTIHSVEKFLTVVTVVNRCWEPKRWSKSQCAVNRNSSPQDSDLKQKVAHTFPTSFVLHVHHHTHNSTSKAILLYDTPTTIAIVCTREYQEDYW